MFRPPGRDFDFWSHVGSPGTHVYAVITNPWSGLMQGAEEYLRYTAVRSGVDPEVAYKLRSVLNAWDAHQ